MQKKVLVQHFKDALTIHVLRFPFVSLLEELFLLLCFNENLKFAPQVDFPFIRKVFTVYEVPKFRVLIFGEIFRP